MSICVYRILAVRFYSPSQNRVFHIDMELLCGGLILVYYGVKYNTNNTIPDEINVKLDDRSFKSQLVTFVLVNALCLREENAKLFVNSTSSKTNSVSNYSRAVIGLFFQFVFV